MKKRFIVSGAQTWLSVSERDTRDLFVLNFLFHLTIRCLVFQMYLFVVECGVIDEITWILMIHGTVCVCCRSPCQSLVGV